MKLRTLIVDDEKPARDLLQDYSQKIEEIELLGMAKNGLEAKKMLNKAPIDLLFLDIQMPDLSGIDLLKILDKKPCVVITSAYKNYAIESFELDVLDYIVKPISLERFYKSVRKAHDFLRFNAHEKSLSFDFLFLKDGNRLTKVNFRDISYIEGYREYLKIHQAASNTLLTLMSFTSVEQMLPESYFQRIHRSYLVNLKHLKHIQPKHVVLDDGTVLPISSTYKKPLQDHLIKMGFSE